jgi:hypothetical protein
LTYSVSIAVFSNNAESDLGFWYNFQIESYKKCEYKVYRISMNE